MVTIDIDTQINFTAELNRIPSRGQYETIRLSYRSRMLVLRNDTSAQKDRIAERLLVLQQELLNRANNREAYDDITEEIFHLRELQQQTDFDETTKAIQMDRIKELQDFIGQQSNELTEFDEKLAKRWLWQITVWDDHYTVELKSGLSIDVPA